MLPGFHMSDTFIYCVFTVYMYKCIHTYLCGCLSLVYVACVTISIYIWIHFNVRLFEWICESACMFVNVKVQVFVTFRSLCIIKNFTVVHATIWLFLSYTLKRIQCFVDSLPGQSKQTAVSYSGISLNLVRECEISRYLPLYLTT